jgi:hypothetical protein
MVGLQRWNVLFAQGTYLFENLASFASDQLDLEVYL